MVAPLNGDEALEEEGSKNRNHYASDGYKNPGLVHDVFDRQEEYDEAIKIHDSFQKYQSSVVFIGIIARNIAACGRDVAERKINKYASYFYEWEHIRDHGRREAKKIEGLIKRNQDEIAHARSFNGTLKEKLEVRAQEYQSLLLGWAPTAELLDMHFYDNSNMLKYLGRLKKARSGLEREKIAQETATHPDEFIQKVEAAQQHREIYYSTRDNFALHNLKFVMSIAWEYESRAHGALDINDLYSVGQIGLFKAIDRFDPRLGYKFSTYAQWWIKQSIRRELQYNGSLVRIPIHLHDKLGQLRRARIKLEYEYPDMPLSAEDLAAETGFNVRDVERMEKLNQSVVSLDAPIDDQGTTFYHLLKDERSENITEKADMNILTERIDAVLDTLTERERAVLVYRFGLKGRDDLTLDEVGRIFKVTRERVRQIEAKALRKLRYGSRMRLLTGSNEMPVYDTMP